MATDSHLEFPPIPEDGFQADESSGSIFTRNSTFPSVQFGRRNMQFTKSSSPRSKRWMLGKSHKKAHSYDGTILHAVPQGGPVPSKAANVLGLSNYEIAMATSPNDEVLSAIGRMTPSPTPEIRPASRFSSHRSASPALSPKASKKQSTASIIGVWKDGKARWDQDLPVTLVANASQAFLSDPSPINSTFSQASPKRASSSSKEQRPRIQVVIPGQQPGRPLQPVPSTSKRTSKSVNGTNMSTISPPGSDGTLRSRGSMISPLSQASSSCRSRQKASKLLGMPLYAIPEPHRPSDVSDSDTSFEEEEEQISSYSESSSMTSVEQEAEQAPEILKPVKFDRQTGSATYSIKSPHRVSLRGDQPNPSTPLSGRKLRSPQLETAIPPSPSGRESRLSLNKPLPPKPARGKPAPPEVIAVSRAASTAHPPVAWSPNRRPSYVSMSKGRRRSSATSFSKRRISQASSTGRRRGSQSSIASKRSTIKVRSRPTARYEIVDAPMPKAPFCRRTDTPTWSQAEQDLEIQLTAFSEVSPFHWEEVPLAMVPSTAETPPAIPPRNRPSGYFSERGSIRVSPNHIAAQNIDVRRTTSSVPIDGARKNKNSRIRQLKQNVGKLSMPFNHHEVQYPAESPVVQNYSFEEPQPKATQPTGEAEPELNISVGDAESIILKILENLDSLDDLFATAVLNKAFYRVFKDNELRLMRMTLKRQSLAAWEFREICTPNESTEINSAAPKPDYTAKSYFACYLRDAYVIAGLKSIVLRQCKTFLRPETIRSLTSINPEVASRFNDAAWRVWTFCQTFGCGKGREEDIIGQMDWLKGGVLAHQQTCTCSIVEPPELESSSVLMSAPECFGKGNPGGLSAEQLFDMTELWNCLSALISGVSGMEGRTEQARAYGLFDCTAVQGGDIDGEEVMLEEWCHWIKTLGLSAVLDLSIWANDPSPTAFMLAAEQKWTSWPAPDFDGGRSTFLKEALSRVYEEQIAAIFGTNSPIKQEMREVTSRRMAGHIAEIRLKKATGGGTHVRMSQERPMSMWSSVMNRLESPIEIPANVETMEPLQKQPRGLQLLLPTPRMSMASSYAEQEIYHAGQVITVPVPPMPNIHDHPAFRQSQMVPLSPGLLSQPAFRTSFMHTEDVVRPTFRESTLQGRPSSRVVPSMYDRPVSPTQPNPRPESSASNLYAEPSYLAQPASVPQPPSITPPPSSYTPPQRQASPSYNTGLKREISRATPRRMVLTQHPLQREMADNNPAENSAEKAIRRIVEMGFTCEDAKRALRMTDLGDGLRVDRAVEMLLRGN